MPSVADVSGIYVVEEGFQSIQYEGEDEEVSEFTRDDNIRLPVDQSGNAVKLFTCMGVLDESLVAECDWKEEVGIDGCQHNTGTLTFNDDETLDVKIHFDFEDSWYGKAKSDVELKMSRVRDTCSQGSGG